MECNQCEGIELETKQWVAYSLKKFRKNRLNKATRSFINALLTLGVEGRTLLDIGGGLALFNMSFWRQAPVRRSAWKPQVLT